MEAFTKTVLKELKENKAPTDTYDTFSMTCEAGESEELKQKVTDALVDLWKNGYIEAYTEKVAPNDPNSPFYRPTNIQVTDKGIQALNTLS